MTVRAGTGLRAWSARLAAFCGPFLAAKSWRPSRLLVKGSVPSCLEFVVPIPKTMGAVSIGSEISINVPKLREAFQALTETGDAANDCMVDQTCSDHEEYVMSTDSGTSRDQPLLRMAAMISLFIALPVQIYSSFRATGILRDSIPSLWIDRQFNRPEIFLPLVLVAGYLVIRMLYHWATSEHSFAGRIAWLLPIMMGPIGSVPYYFAVYKRRR